MGKISSGAKAAATEDERVPAGSREALEGLGALSGRDARPGPLRGLVTLRLVSIFTMLRRTEILAHRRLFGLSEIEWQIITYAGQRAPFSLSRLAELTSRDEGQLSRAVKKMVTRGLLTRARKPGGPAIEIGLSDDGRSVYQTMVERAVARDKYLTEGIEADDLEALWRVSEAMIVKARSLLDEQNEAAAPEKPALPARRGRSTASRQ